MPEIASFYGIVVLMYYFDNRRHNLPHIHTVYQEHEGVYSIPEGNLLEGSLPPSKERLLLAWIEIHKQELMDDWVRAIRGERISKIDPLR